MVVVGRVTDAGGRAPIAGATVSLQGGNLGATTDSAGRYRLSLPAKMRGTSITMDARRIGYRPVQRTVRVNADSLTIDFALQVSAMHLPEEDFNDDEKDAGDLGTGHSVAALYEALRGTIP